MAGMKIAAPAILKKLIHDVTVPEIVMGKSSLAWERITIPNALKKPREKKMKPYQIGFWTSTIPIRRKRLIE